MMQILAPLLFAQADKMRNLGSHFRGETSDFTWHDAVMPVVAFAVVGALLWLAFRFSQSKERRAIDNPRALFRELCRAHGLDTRSMRLLADLARCHGLANPALLFVEPERFEPAYVNVKLPARSAELEELASRLFAPASLDVVA
jgi:hypothetical protein